MLVRIAEPEELEQIYAEEDATAHIDDLQAAFGLTRNQAELAFFYNIDLHHLEKAPDTCPVCGARLVQEEGYHRWSFSMGYRVVTLRCPNVDSHEGRTCYYRHVHRLDEMVGRFEIPVYDEGPFSGCIVPEGD